MGRQPLGDLVAVSALSDEEALAIFALDALEAIAGETGHRPEVSILDAMTAEAEETLGDGALSRWLRAGQPRRASARPTPGRRVRGLRGRARGARRAAVGDPPAQAPAADPVGLAAFLVISGVLARWLSLENAERNDIAQRCCGAGPRRRRLDDRPALPLRRPLPRRSCGATRAGSAAGPVLILADQSATAYALTSTDRDTRVAWRAGG